MESGVTASAGLGGMDGWVVGLLNPILHPRSLQSLRILLSLGWCDNSVLTNHELRDALALSSRISSLVCMCECLAHSIDVSCETHAMAPRGMDHKVVQTSGRHKTTRDGSMSQSPWEIMLFVP
jgi:hypothetical protein